MTLFETISVISGQSRDWAAQLKLVAAGCGLIVAMALIVPVVSASTPFPYCYIFILAIYWIGYCIPVTLGCVGDHPRVTSELFDARLHIVVAALALPVLVAIGAGTLNIDFANPELIILAIGVGLINGPLEEFAWRRPYRSNGHRRLRFEFLGLFLFTLWHLPLLLYLGVSYDYGALGLLGGAFFMGLVWLMMTRAANSIAWPAVSHAFVNIRHSSPCFGLS